MNDTRPQAAVVVTTPCGKHEAGTCTGYGTECVPRHSSEEILAHRASPDGIYSYVWDETVRTVHKRVDGKGTYETGTWVPRPGVVFTVTAVRGAIWANALVCDVPAGEAIAERFPKSAGVRATHCSGDWDGHRGSVSWQAKLSADRVNGGVNEAGMRRWRSFTRNAAKAGYVLRYSARYGNSLTAAEFAELTGTQLEEAKSS